MSFVFLRVVIGSGASFDYDSEPSPGVRRGSRGGGSFGTAREAPPAPSFQASSPLGRDDVQRFVSQLVKEVVGR